MNQKDYWAGRDWAVAKGVTKDWLRDLPPPKNDFERGIWDQVNGVQAPVARPGPAGPPVVAPRYRPPVNPTPNPNAPPVVVRPPTMGYPGPTLYQPQYLEVAASIFGQRMPLDYAVNLENRQASDWLILGLQFGTSVQVLGEDPGDRRRGYRLSGSQGPIARRVAAAVAEGRLPADPRYLGTPRGPLKNWYGAKTSTGVRLLFRSDLEQLGVLSDYEL